MRKLMVSAIAIVGILSIVFSPSVRLPWREDGDLWAVGWLAVVLAVLWLPVLPAPITRQRLLRSLAALAIPAILVVAVQNVIAMQSIGWPIWPALVTVIAIVIYARYPSSSALVSSGFRQIVVSAVLVFIILVGFVGAVSWARYEVWRARQNKIQAIAAREKGEVIVSRFTDYRCASCAYLFDHYDTTVQTLVLKMSGRVTFKYYEVPQDPGCNSGPIRSRQPFSCKATIFAHVAERVGRRAEAEKLLFQKRTAFTSEDLDKVAEEFGLTSAIQEHFDDEVTRIKADVEFAAGLGIVAVPVYYVNGIKVRYWTEADMSAFIQREVKRGSWMGGQLFGAFLSASFR